MAAEQGVARRALYGGQAVLEGVMIRGQRAVAVAVRRPAGDVVVRCDPLHQFVAGRWRRIPFIRGVVVLVETLVLGIRALMYSAAAALEDGKEASKQGLSGATSAILWVSLAFALAFSIGVFFLGPLFMVREIDPYIGSSIVSNILEGLIRLSFFLLYLVAIGWWSEIRRVFAYHGAEHMTIHAYEHGVPLTVEEVRKYPTAHPRCGTAFLLTVMVVSIFVFALLGRPDWPLRIASRVFLVPVVAALSYEVIRFHGAHMGNALVRVLAAPSLALQALTTRDPEDPQIEVAITAMTRVLEEDGVAASPRQAGETTGASEGTAGPPQ
jgi:uncharacterized protein YqhQ